MPQILNPVFFDGFELTSVSGLTVLATNPYIPPKRKLSIHDLVRTHKSKVSSAFYNERAISVKVGITRANRELLETSIDSLMGMLHGLEKELIMPQGGAMRKYYASFLDTIVHLEGGSYIEMSLIFTCADRFGYDLQATLALVITYTPSAVINFFGSAPFQAPVITISYSAITGGTAKDVVVGNGVSGQQVTITRTWTAGDVLEIDSYNKTVKVNSVEVAFSGAIPEWSSGQGAFTYSDTLTTRTLTGSVVYYKRYA